MTKKPTYEELEQRVKELEQAEFARKRDLDELRESEPRTLKKLDDRLPNGDPDATTLNLTNIIDIQAIQSMMDDFFNLTNIGIAIIDLHGKILVATGWQDICTQFHRKHPESCKNCLESDLELSNGIEPGTFRVYRCQNNMWDMATPITVGDKHVGNLYLGQFLFEAETPDLEVFRSQAQKYGFNEGEYLAALERVPRWSHETVDIVMTFYTKLAQMISEMSYSNIKIAQTLKERDKLLNSLRESEAFLKTLIDTIPTPVFYKDKDGKYLGFNRAFETFFGEKRERLIGKSVFDINPPELAETYHAQDDVLFNSGGVQRYESQWKNAHGELRDFIFNKAVFGDSKGNIAGLIGILLDITDRNRAIESLRVSEGKFSKAFESAPVLMTISSIEDGRYLDINDTFVRVTGYNRETAIGTASIELGFIDSENRNRIAESLHAEGCVKELELELNRADGTKLNCLYWGEVIEVEGKKRLLSIASDITDRKQDEKALKESKMFLDNMSDIAYMADAQLNVVWVNSAIERITGLPPEEIIGKPFLPLFIEADRASLMDVYKRTLLGESLENTLTFTSGVTCHFTSLPKRNAKGEIIGTFGVARDITERLIAQKALQVSEDRLKKAQEAAGIGNWEYDMSTGRVWGSEEVFRIYEIERTSEYLPLDEVENHIIEAERVNQALVDLITKGDDYDIEFQITQKNSQRLLTIHSIADLIKDDEGNPVKVLGVIQDVTDKKVKEQEHIKLLAQLQQAQKMEAIGTLAGGIAHDFNNLLMAIQGRASIMLMNKDSSHPDIRHLKGIEDDIESAADLTRQLLGFARGGKYEVRPTDLNEVIKKQNRMFGRTKKEISIRGKYEKDLWSVEVDRGQFEQVLLNLYVNAWQAMPGGGDLYLKTENVTINRTDVKPFSIEPGRYVKISVTDTGVGMDKKTREKIFEPFFTTKEMGRGTGLGLASAYGIIKNHGGFINVYSEKGHGATFNIYLPASEKEVIEEKKPAGETVSGTETVLFVDDEDMIIELAEELFEGLGYKVLTAGSGREAIETYEKNKERIDMVLLDMVMPDMGGDETYDKLKKINPDIKVLLASGYSMNGQATEIMDRGCSGFIQKPFKMRELSQKLREILDGK